MISGDLSASIYHKSTGTAPGAFANAVFFG